jgi:ubiquinone biosynthesis protein
MALEELGTVAIKLGQMLSTRPDIMPPAYQHELAALQDAVPPVPVAAICGVVTTALGHPVETVYATFDETPLATASIGQVHAATLADGTEVVVKVRRPGVVAQVNADLTLLRHLAQQASKHLDIAARYDVEGLVEEFGRTLQRELDYRREGRNVERFARNYADDAEVIIPRVYWEATAEGVLTLSHLHGVKISDTSTLAAAGHDCAEIAERAAKIVLRMVFEHGFYHADPHPGNFLIMEGGEIGLLDFGMVGNVPPRLQRQLAAVVIAVATRDSERLVDRLLDLGFTAGPIDRTRFAADLERLLEDTYDVPLGEIALAPLLQELLTLLRHYHLRLPAALSLLVKTMIMDESLGTMLDPSFQAMSVLVSYAQQLIWQEFGPLHLARQVAASGDDLLWLGTDFPRHARRLVGDLERGTMQIGPTPDTFQPLVRHVERIANRLVLGVLAAAFVNGVAVLMAVYHLGPGSAWLAAFFAFGLAAVILLGLALMWMTWRARRR